MLNVKGGGEKNEFILASGSPWRKRLLKKHGINCRVQVSNFKEKRSHRDPKKLALYNARGKALLVANFLKIKRRGPPAVVIGVDTIVVLGNKIIGKPTGKLSAKRMLASLAGKTHRVISGLFVINTATGKTSAACVTTAVTFKNIKDGALERYLRSNQWKGKAGSYAIQGMAKSFIKKIDGDITNVIGIPIKRLKEILTFVGAFC